MARVKQNETLLPHWAQRSLRELRDRVECLQRGLPFGGRTPRRMTVHGDACHPNPAGYCACADMPVATPDEANLVCSDVANSAGGLGLRCKMMHKPVIDIDLPCSLVESSPGKFHLYIEKEVGADDYWALLHAFVNAGIVEPGYYESSTRKGYSAVRHPDHLKPPTGFLNA